MSKDKNHINLLVTIDRKYIGPLSVMLKSYIETNSGVRTDLYIAHSSLGEDEFIDIDEIAKSGDVRVHNMKITERWFSRIPVLERLPEESFYRLLAFHFLPEELDRCLYLDPDIIIHKSLQPLYDMALENNYIAASSHMRGYRNRFNKRRLSLKKQDRYINSGIMLMNLNEIRRDFSLDGILSCLEETAIIHYNGKCKPWLNGYEGELDAFYPEVKEKGPAPSDVAKKHVKFFFHITKLTPQQTIVVGGALSDFR